MRLSILFAATVAVLAAENKAQSHEFWIDPDAFEIAVGETLIADLRVGTEFSGAQNSFLPNRFEVFEVIAPTGTLPVVGRFGDIPALQLDGAPDGLAVAVHQTTATRLTWGAWEDFLAFAEHKDIGDVTALHEARGVEPGERG